MGDFTIVIDTREQTPFTFEGFEAVRGSLKTGDYSIQGFTDVITIERKSLSDIVSCCGASRERFKNELHRMRGFKYKFIIIESTLKRIEGGNWRGKVKPAHVLGSIASWRIRYGIEFIYAGDASQGSRECLRLLRKYHDFCEEWVRRFR